MLSIYLRSRYCYVYTNFCIDRKIAFSSASICDEALKELKKVANYCYFSRKKGGGAENFLFPFPGWQCGNNCKIENDCFAKLTQKKCVWKSSEKKLRFLFHYAFKSKNNSESIDVFWIIDEKKRLKLPSKWPIDWRLLRENYCLQIYHWINLGTKNAGRISEN